VSFCESLARRVVLTIDNARLLRKTQQLNTKLEQRVAERTAELQLLASHLQTAREDERTSLARELHDELGQLLTVPVFEVRQLAKTLAEPAEGAVVLSQMAQGLNQFARLLDDCIRSVRTL